MRKLPIAEVEWIDSSASGSWRKRQEYEKEQPSECRTAGYLLKANRHCVVIVQSIDPEGDNVSDSMTIPRSCVKSVTRLEKKP